MSLSIRADRSLIRTDVRSRRYVAVELCAPEAQPREGRLPVNLGFVIDRSGSMDGPKLQHARQAVVAGIRSLREGDRFAVVAYDDQVDVVVPSREATATARDEAVKAVEQIDTGGTTDLHGGWSRGCEQVVESLAKEAVGRCVLLTDGLANAGVTDHDEIVRQCASWRDRRVVTTALGLGAGFDETLLRRMSDAGGGNFQFIESAPQIADVMASEVGEALAITVREAVLVVDAGEGALVESLNAFPCRQEGGSWRIALGSLFGGQQVTAILAVTMPVGEVGNTRDVVITVDDQDGVLRDVRGTLQFTWASPSANDRQEVDGEVDRLVAVIDAARAEREALDHNRHGDYTAARGIMQRAIDDLRARAGGDPRIAALADDLQRKRALFGRAMDPASSKSYYSASNVALKSRTSYPGPHAGQKPARREGQKARPPRKQPAERLELLLELEVQSLVAAALRKVAAADPDLLAGLDVAALAQALAHETVRGCLLDAQPDSNGVLELDLRRRRLCPQCRGILEALGVSSERIAGIVEALRRLATPDEILH